jgi:hypothetical protein
MTFTPDHHIDSLIQALKARIRRLRLISRVLSFLISLAVLIPITMTLVKFLSTKNTFRAVIQDGKEILRTAWAKDTRASPTYVYFSIAMISVILNFLTIFAYQFGIEKANVASYAASWFSMVVMVGNLVVWSVAAAMYREEKDKNGKSNDLWGWTCSAGARAIQKEFVKELNFDQYCNVQVRGIPSRFCWEQETNLRVEHKLVYWPCASGCGAIDCGYLCYGFDAKEIKEESRAAPQAEWIRAQSALERELVRGSMHFGIEGIT